MELEHKQPTNLKECDKIDWCSYCEYGDRNGNTDIDNCERRREFIRAERKKNPKDTYIAYHWFNVRTIGELKEALTLVADEVEIDIDLRYVENLTKRTREMQYQIPRKPRNPETLK